jgi:Carboxypeptidase regulatory-like domain
MRPMRILTLLAWIVLIPTLVSAQAVIAGTVRDSSGAVLPGVTVEATSPALIEKVRTAVSDGTGQYRVEDLRPGLYTVTYTLQGFNTFKREASS